MKFTGKIDTINHIVISDPSYSKNVFCRYEKENLNEKDWFVDLTVKTNEDPELSGYDINLLLYKTPDIVSFENGKLSCFPIVKTEHYEIGMDSACVSLGINKKADEIIKYKDLWQPPGCLRTGYDGYFGDIVEGKIGDDLSFLFINGYLDKEMGYDESTIIDYLEDQFEIKDLQKVIEKDVVSL